MNNLESIDNIGYDELFALHGYELANADHEI